MAITTQQHLTSINQQFIVLMDEVKIDWWSKKRGSFNIDLYNDILLKKEEKKLKIGNDEMRRDL